MLSSISVSYKNYGNAIGGQLSWYSQHFIGKTIDTLDISIVGSNLPARILYSSFTSSLEKL